MPSGEIEPPASDEVYFHDLVGLRVERSDGDALGRVEALHEMPQGLVLEVSTKGGTVMLPYRPEVVTTVDLGRRAVVVQVPDGLMDEDVAEDRDTEDRDTEDRDTEDRDTQDRD